VFIRLNPWPPGFIMAVYGAFDAVASVLIGRMADVVGKRFVLLVWPGELSADVANPRTDSI